MAEIELKSDSLLSVKLKDNGPQSTSVGPVVRIGFAINAPVPVREGDAGGVEPGVGGGAVVPGVGGCVVPDMIPKT